MPNKYLDALQGGLLGLTTDTLGAPVDLATMAMRPFGYKVPKPVGGSEWLADKLRVPIPTSGVGQAARVVGGLLSPDPMDAVKVAGLLGMMKKSDIGYKASKGKDVLGRDIPDWADAMVVHSTDNDAAKAIQSEGYKLGSGYYGDAVSFTPDWKYSSQFGDVSTVAKVSPKAKILNLNDPVDDAKFKAVQEAMKRNPQWYRNNDYRSAMRSLGYDGLYDPGAGDLFIYRPSAVQYMDLLER